MRRITSLVGILLLLAACGAPPAKRLTVVPDALVLAPGGEARLEARLSGVTGGVRWRAERGTIVGAGTAVTYRAPGHPADDRVVVESLADPGLRAEVRVSVRSGGVVGNRIRVVSDRALIFGRVGEQRVFEVEVLDDLGRPVPDARVRFESADPARFRVTPIGPRKARIEALDDALGTVRILARYRDAETWGEAVFAEFQPDALHLAGDLVLEADWDPARRAWVRVVLRRTPETEGLRAGQVFFTGDRTGVWGRIASVRVEPDRVVLVTGKAALPDLFRRLRYRDETPEVAVQSVLLPGGRAALRVQSGGDVRLVPLGACETDLEGVEVTEPYLGEIRRFWIEAYVELEFGLDPLDRAGLVFHGEAGLVANGGRVRVDTPSGEVFCRLWQGEVSLPAVSILVLSINVDLYPQVYVYADVTASGASLLLQGPRARAVARAAVGFRYDDAHGWQFVDDFGFDTGLDRPRLAMTLRSHLELETGPGAAVELGASVRAFGENLLSGRLLELVGELPFFVRVPVWAVERADYAGVDWGFGYRLLGYLKLELGGPLADLVTEIFGEGATDLGRTKLFEAEDRKAFLAATRTRIRLAPAAVDLGRGEAATFVLSDDDGLSGRVEAWLRGGVCPSNLACFGPGVPLRRVASGPDGGGPEVRLTWTPGPGDVGYYEVQGRHWLGLFEEVAPYASRAARGLIVRAPELDALPAGLLLKGKYDAEATGVLSYQNRTVSGLGPDGTPHDFTSPLSVTLSPPAGVAADPASVTLGSGDWAFHRLSYPCPGSPTAFDTALRLTTNDPDEGRVDLPVRVECTPNNPPTARILKTAVSGNELRVIGRGRDPDGDPLGCYFDFGDGSPREERPLGSPDCDALDVRHTYAEAGTYQVTFVVFDSDGDRDVDRKTETVGP